MILKRDNITFLEGYFISKSGRLWSRYDKSGHLTKDSWHRVKYNTSKGGYKFIQRKGKIYYIHRLVAMTYIPNPENKPCVCHKDNVPYHNSVSNLYWGTPSENTQQCIRDGRGYIGDKNPLYGVSRRGALNPNAKLTKIQRRLIKQRHKEGCRICDLAKEFKVSRITIRRIIDQKLRSYNRKDNILYLSI